MRAESKFCPPRSGRKLSANRVRSRKIEHKVGEWSHGFQIQGQKLHANSIPRSFFDKVLGVGTLR